MQVINKQHEIYIPREDEKAHKLDQLCPIRMLPARLKTEGMIRKTRGIIH